MKRGLLAVLGLGMLMAAPLLAQPVGEAAGQKPDEAKQEEAVRRAEEITVESASKVETALINAPATMSVGTAGSGAPICSRNTLAATTATP